MFNVHNVQIHKNVSKEFRIDKTWKYERAMYVSCLRFPGRVLLQKLDLVFSSSIRDTRFKLGDVREHHMTIFVNLKKFGKFS